MLISHIFQPTSTSITDPHCCLTSLLTMHLLLFSFFFNATAPTEIYTLSLHDALPIFHQQGSARNDAAGHRFARQRFGRIVGDRKSTRLNSSHLGISYAVFCLKKKKKKKNNLVITTKKYRN